MNITSVYFSQCRQFYEQTCVLKNGKSSESRKRGYFFLTLTEDTRGAGIGSCTHTYTHIIFSLLDRCPTRQTNFFGKIPQQAAKGRVRSGIELECNCRKVTVVE